MLARSRPPSTDQAIPKESTGESAFVAVAARAINVESLENDIGFLLLAVMIAVREAKLAEPGEARQRGGYRLATRIDVARSGGSG